jgi:hypothetical protein
LRVFGVAGTAPYEDWIDAHARVEAPDAVVEARGAWLRASELDCFLHDLDSMHRDLRGTAALHRIEPVLRVDMACGRRGEIAKAVEISPNPPTQSHRFDFAIDQSDLPPALAALRRMALSLG